VAKQLGIGSSVEMGEVVERLPASASVLDSFRSACCCDSRGWVSAAHGALGMLTADGATGVVEFAFAAMGQPGSSLIEPPPIVDRVEFTRHAYLSAELATLDALAERVASAHGGQHPELLEVLADVKELADDLHTSLRENESVSWRTIRMMSVATDPVGSRGGPDPVTASTVPAEQGETGRLLDQVRLHTRDFALPADACSSYSALYIGLAKFEVDTLMGNEPVLLPGVSMLDDRDGAP